MLFGRRKKGFAKEEEITEFSTEFSEDANQDELEEEKVDLMDYLEELDEADDTSIPLEEKEMEVIKEEKTEAQLLAEFIRIRSHGAHLTDRSSLDKKDQDLEELLTSINNDEACKDITFIKGDKDIYYYSNKFMSDNYAKIAVLVEDKDISKTIAEMVRWNCKTYPCATPLYYFNNSPYFHTEPQIERALERMGQEEEYSDICELRTGNNVRYLYSTIHMSEKYARALAEGVEYGEYGYR